MNSSLAHFLTGLYPASWRKRYGREFEALLEEHKGGIRVSLNIVWSALYERLVPTREVAYSRNSGGLGLLCERAPWAVFSVVPMLLLVGAYFLACFILWSGWKMFLPDADSPFGSTVNGFANLYFQLGRFYYFSAPILLGWGIAIIAVREKTNPVWPIVSSAIISWIASSAQIRAGRSAVPNGIGHIAMAVNLIPSAQNLYEAFLRSSVTFSLIVAPYLVWRCWQILRSLL